MIEHRDYKRGSNKKEFSRSDIAKGIARYEEKIITLEKEIEKRDKLLEQAKKYLVYVKGFHPRVALSHEGYQQWLKDYEELK